MNSKRCCIQNYIQEKLKLNKSLIFLTSLFWKLSELLFCDLLQIKLWQEDFRVINNRYSFWKRNKLFHIVQHSGIRRWVTENHSFMYPHYWVHNRQIISKISKPSPILEVPQMLLTCTTLKVSRGAYIESDKNSIDRYGENFSKHFQRSRRFLWVFQKIFGSFITKLRKKP